MRTKTYITKATRVILVLSIVSCAKNNKSDAAETSGADAKTKTFIQQYQAMTNLSSFYGNYKITSVKKNSVIGNCSSDMVDTSKRGLYPNSTYLQISTIMPNDPALVGRPLVDAPSTTPSASDVKGYILGDFDYAKNTSKVYGQLAQGTSWDGSNCTFPIPLSIFKKVDKTITIEEQEFRVPQPGLTKSDCSTDNDAKFKAAWDNILAGSVNCYNRTVLTAE